MQGTHLAIIVSILLGGVTVLQSGLNRKFGQAHGLSAALVLNALVLIVVGSAFFFAQKRGLPVPDAIRSEALVGLRRWWFVIPGLCGFLIIVGFPFAMGYIGASFAFVLAISAQLVGSLIWDAFVEHHPLSWARVVSVALAIAAAGVATWDRTSS